MPCICCFTFCIRMPCILDPLVRDKGLNLLFPFPGSLEMHRKSDDQCGLVRQVVERPATSLVSTLLTAVYLYITSHEIGYAEVGLNYDLAVQKLELWRILTAQVSHVELLHLLFNLSTLWSLGVIEESNTSGVKGGTIYYLQTSLVLLIFSGLVRDPLIVILACILAFLLAIAPCSLWLNDHTTPITVRDIQFAMLT